MCTSRFEIAALCLALVAAAPLASGDPLTIYDIQHNTSDGDASVYSGQIQSVTGGVVTHVWFGSRSRVYLQDPAHPGWGAIVVKDWQSGELANSVQVGDWVSLENILVEEYRGTTYLQYNRTWAPSVAFNIVSNGNPVPDPALLTAADLRVPVDHAASEPYESSVAVLENVVVGQRDLGKNADNYELLQGTDVAWGTDYMNIDAGGPYHPWIYPGAVLERIGGIVEQYTRPQEGWDYYQLCTRSSSDIVPEAGSLLLLLAAGAFVNRRR